jgi:hypothetical protein
MSVWCQQEAAALTNTSSATAARNSEFTEQIRIVS